MEITAEQFTYTTGTLSREAGIAAETIRHYADEGWVECLKLPNGLRLFKRSAVASVQQLCRERLARRGGRRVARVFA
jgi:DNA-binding transcriptional MerR regulator